MSNSISKIIAELNDQGKTPAQIRASLVLNEGLSESAAAKAVKEAGISGSVKRGTVDDILDFLAQEERTKEELTKFVKEHATKTHQGIVNTYYDKFRITLNKVRNS